MERYGGVQAKEESSADPVAEWSSPEGETGLEEPMWQLGLGGGDGGGDDSYPERPDEANCIYYLRTGYCGFGSSCRFNHPRDRSAVVGAMRATGGEYPERAGQPVCQYYMRTGMCKFGVSCKYHHPRQGGGSVSSAAISISGYPLRPGEKECSYYLKTGQCKFGITCKFHHPPPTGIHMPGPGPLPAAAAAVPSAIYPTVQPPGPSSQQYGVVAGNWPVARPALLPGSYIQGTYGPVILPPGMVPLPGWNPYQAPLSPVASPSAQTSVGAGPIYGMSQLSSAAPAYGGPYLSPSPAGPSAFNHKEHTFPERPGQPECHYYMKTGDCKFGSSCRYHHPPRWSVPKTNFVLSVMGLPLRPGAQLCSHYAQNGVCKYGPTCKFDHPMSMLNYSPSASSLTDMAVAPYPVGYSIATLAPASLSSDLRPEISGSSKEVLSTRMPTSVSTPAGSVGSIFSRNTPLPHSSVQQSGQSSPPSTGSGGTPHVSEVRTSG